MEQRGKIQDEKKIHHEVASEFPIPSLPQTRNVLVDVPNAVKSYHPTAK